MLLSSLDILVHHIDKIVLDEDLIIAIVYTCLTKEVLLIT